MQPAHHPEPLAEAAPAAIALDPARLLGGLLAHGGTAAGRIMVGGKEKPFEPVEPLQVRAG